MFTEIGRALMPTILIAAVVIGLLLGLAIVIARSTSSSYTRNMRAWGYYRNRPGIKKAGLGKHNSGGCRD